MEEAKTCRNTDILCIAGELAARWERSQSTGSSYKKDDLSMPAAEFAGLLEDGESDFDD